MKRLQKVTNKLIRKLALLLRLSRMNVDMAFLLHQWQVTLRQNFLACFHTEMLCFGKLMPSCNYFLATAANFNDGCVDTEKSHCSPGLA